jgi:hypothetical protein
LTVLGAAGPVTAEQQIREKARAGTLLPPGRKADDEPL